MKVQNILTAILKVYSQCSNYEDTGFVTNGTKIDRPIAVFRTVFEQSSFFLFEYTASDSTCLVLRFDSGGIQLKFSRGPERKFEHLNDAFAAIGGRSQNALTIIPSLFMPSAFQSLSPVAELEQAAVDFKNEPLANLIEGYFKLNQYKLWVRPKDNRIVQCGVVSPLTVQRREEIFQHIREDCPDFDMSKISEMPSFIQTVVIESSNLN